MSYQPPAIPAELTRKNWDKKKGVVAKAHGKTGVGDALDEIKKAYDKVDWKLFDSLDYMGRGANKKTMDACVAKMIAEVKGPMRKVVEQCYKTRDLCKDVAGQFKKKKTIPGSTTKLVESIGKTADQFGVGLNFNSMSDVIAKAHQAKLDDFKKKCTFTIDAFKKSTSKVKGIANTLDGLAGKVSGDPDPALIKKINEDVAKASRDLTQPLGNLMKFQSEFGFKVQGVDATAGKKIYDILVVWGDTKQAVWDTGDTPTAAEVKAEVKKFATCVTACDKMAGSAKFVG